MINVTKTYLPPLEEYSKYLEGIWERSWVTNYGPLVQQLESELKVHLGVKHIQFTSNGTIAIQIAIKALELTGEIITTPFSYVATTTSILWENCQPVFVDVEDKTFCIDADKIEEAITPRTSAILATHVYGYPCDVDKIKKIADKYNLRVIYDGAHAFGVQLHGQSIFNFGDISTISFHATKLFHTIEGGAVVCTDLALHEKMLLYKSFGHRGDDYFSMGINGKNSEFHAAMGLCNLPKINGFIQQRKRIAELYTELLSGLVITNPQPPGKFEYNYAYFPVIFRSEQEMLAVKKNLADAHINTRRYFYPSLNQLPYLQGQQCKVSEDIASRVLCLPFYHELETENMYKICKIIIETVRE